MKGFIQLNEIAKLPVNIKQSIQGAEIIFFRFT